MLLIIILLRLILFLRTELAERWYNIVGSGDEKHLRAGTGIEFIKSKDQLYGYLSNYVKKLDQKTPPAGFENVGRFWGASRSIVACLCKKIGHYFRLARNTKFLRSGIKLILDSLELSGNGKVKGLQPLMGHL